MLVPVIILFCIVIFGLRIHKENQYEEYLSFPQTQAIKGIFVITVFFNHFCSYIQIKDAIDLPMLYYYKFFGQLMVAPFLFYSGYGVFESLKKKGPDYVQSFPKKRILKTLIHFELAVLLFLGLDLLIGIHPSIQNIFFSFAAWKSIGNSNWFVFAIIMTYLFSYLALTFLKKAKLSKILAGITFLTLCYIIALYFLKPNCSWWWNTIICYPLGCAYSIYKGTIEQNFSNSKKYFSTVFVFFIFFLLGKLGVVHSRIFNSQICVISFICLVILLSMKISIRSKILEWFGIQVFGIYILQRLPMTFFKYLKLDEKSIYLYFCACFATVLILNFIFSKLTRKIDNRFFA